ncbi:hypothetical protein LTR60_005252, partial [Cryomyces antarcticus]
YAFFAYPYFDPAVLRQTEARKQPFAVAELLTEPLVYPVVAAEFAAPVLIVAAEFDLIFCGGACGIPGSSVYVPPGGRREMRRARPSSPRHVRSMSCCSRGRVMG